jgi:hypothetical protein
MKTEAEQKLEERLAMKKHQEDLEKDTTFIVPEVNILHETSEPPRIHSTFVQQRLAGEPVIGPPTNITAEEFLSPKENNNLYGNKAATQAQDSSDDDDSLTNKFANKPFQSNQNANNLPRGRLGGGGAGAGGLGGDGYLTASTENLLNDLLSPMGNVAKENKVSSSSYVPSSGANNNSSYVPSSMRPAANATDTGVAPDLNFNGNDAGVNR